MDISCLCYRVYRAWRLVTEEGTEGKNEKFFCARSSAGALAASPTRRWLPLKRRFLLQVALQAQPAGATSVSRALRSACQGCGAKMQIEVLICIFPNGFINLGDSKFVIQELTSAPKTYRLRASLKVKLLGQVFLEMQNGYGR